VYIVLSKNRIRQLVIVLRLPRGSISIKIFMNYFINFHHKYFLYWRLFLHCLQFLYIFTRCLFIFGPKSPEKLSGFKNTSESWHTAKDIEWSRNIIGSSIIYAYQIMLIFLCKYHDNSQSGAWRKSAVWLLDLKNCLWVDVNCRLNLY